MSALKSNDERQPLLPQPKARVPAPPAEGEGAAVDAHGPENTHRPAFFAKQLVLSLAGLIAFLCIFGSGRPLPVPMYYANMEIFWCTFAGILLALAAALFLIARANDQTAVLRPSAPLWILYPLSRWRRTTDGGEIPGGFAPSSQKTYDALQVLRAALLVAVVMPLTYLVHFRTPLELYDRALLGVLAAAWIVYVACYVPVVRKVLWREDVDTRPPADAADKADDAIELPGPAGAEQV